MNNQELEIKIKEIIAKDNMFDMIIAAKDFEKEYKNSEFYKETKIPLMDIIKDAKVFYTFNGKNIQQKLQQFINEVNVDNLNNLFEQISNIYAKENADTFTMLNELSDFKNIIK